MPSSLQIVQSHAPKIRHIVNAKKALAVTVSLADIKGARPRDPFNCAMARACIRELGVDGAIIGRRTSYTFKGDTAIRYATSNPVKREQTSFDRGASYSPGHYNLCKPQPVLARGSGTRHAGDPRPGKLTHVAYDHVAGVRAELTSMVPAKKKKAKR